LRSDLLVTHLFHQLDHAGEFGGFISHLFQQSGQLRNRGRFEYLPDANLDSDR
jgi:hypothetical protein